ncbi:MAG: hypothetical protein ABR576_02220 [Thermoanaerobaculia bacterium]
MLTRVRMADPRAFLLSFGLATAANGESTPSRAALAITAVTIVDPGAASARTCTSTVLRLPGRPMSSAVETGRLADLLLLEADPLADIRNTRKIAAVVLGGSLLERGGPR